MHASPTDTLPILFLVDYFEFFLLVKWLSTLLPVFVVADISVTCALSIENFTATVDETLVFEKSMHVFLF
jgi:uncharacterized membrane protein (DUF485 family)